MELLAGHRVPAGLSFATVLPDLDFETYSEAGFVWREGTRKWISISGAGKPKGLSQVGAAVYAEHPTTEIISLAYNLKDGIGPRLWDPSLPPPLELFDHLIRGGLLEAFNSSFEFYIWYYVGVLKLGWPPLPIEQLRCAMAKARAFSLPGKLSIVSNIIGLELKDVAAGKKVITRYCIPRNPTKADDRTRILAESEPQGIELHQYCMQDIVAEASVSLACPDLSPEELDMWILDQKINTRGIAIDVPAVKALNSIIDEGKEYYDQRMFELTEGAVANTTKVKDLISWCALRGVWLDNLDEETLEAALDWKLDSSAREALEIRKATSSAGVKKLQALIKRTSSDDRMRDTLIYYRAHTGRWASGGLQMQNMKSSGPKMAQAPCCGNYFPVSEHPLYCPFCSIKDPLGEEVEWDGKVMDKTIDMLTGCNFEQAKYLLGSDLYKAIAASMRGMVVAGPGNELMCSDYSAIEAVVLAVLADETWRIEVFQTHGKIYEQTAADITGVPFDDIVNHSPGNHPHRKPFGKVPELASGYGGWIGAWLAFGAGDFFTEDEIKKHILAWRAASPNIVEMWGGQYRETRPGSWDFEWELHGLEGAAIQAVLTPGEWITWRALRYGVFGDVLYCLLPSGRCLSYHKPLLSPSIDRRSKGSCYSLSHMIYNTNPKKGKMGWIRVETYGGMLTENAVQAVARDLLVSGIKNVEAAGYTVVGHVHDEVISEIPTGFGSIEEYERLLMVLPHWAAGWPIKAARGWRGPRYKKE